MNQLNSELACSMQSIGLPSALRRSAQWFVLAAWTALVAGCATREVNSHASVELPVPVEGLYVIYEPARLAPMQAVVLDRQKPTRDRMIDMLGEGIATTIPAQLSRAGIQSTITKLDPAQRVSIGDAVLGEPKANWRRLFIRPLRSVQTCNGYGICSQQLTVGVSLMSPDPSKAVWTVEIEEPAMQPSFLLQARFDGLADNLARSILRAVAARKPSISPKETP